MFHTQKQTMMNPQADPYNALFNEQKTLKEHLESELKALQQLFDQVILEPPDLQRLFWLRQDLEVQLKQLELLIAELNQLVQPSPTPQW